MHVWPAHAAGVQAGALVCQCQNIRIKAHFQPAFSIALLTGGEGSSADLQHLHQLLELTAAHILGLDKGGGLFHRVDAVLSPVVRLFFNGTQTGIAQVALGAGPLFAIANQNRDHLRRQSQITDKAQQDLQLLSVQVPAQYPLYFAVKGLEIQIAVHSGKHIPLAVLGSLPGKDRCLPDFRPESQLPQCGGGGGIPAGGQIQSRNSLFRVVPSGDVQVQQCRVGVLGAQQLMDVCL